MEVFEDDQAKPVVGQFIDPGDDGLDDPVPGLGDLRREREPEVGTRIVIRSGERTPQRVGEHPERPFPRELVSPG